MSPASSVPEWKKVRRHFVETGGHTTQSFGLGRIIGQIFALLYLSPAPLCLDDIAKELSVSKASVSTTIRQLERWSAVKRVWVQGDRKDYYEAEIDFRKMLKSGLLATMRKKLETAGVEIDTVATSFQQLQESRNGKSSDELKVLQERLQVAKRFHDKVHGLLSNPLVDHLL